MDNRRTSVIDPAGGYGPDTRSQVNTTTLPKPQQRVPEFNQRQPRPEFYQQQQGPYANRPPPQQQQRPPPPPQQQQQQPRTSGDKISPWNIIRQALPPDATFRSPVPPQQRPPQYYNMQQRQPPPPQEQEQQQQYRQQQPAPPPPPPLQQLERRSTLARIEDRPPPFRPENGKLQGRLAGNGTGAGDDDEEVVVNSSANLQQPPLPPPPPPTLNRRDSTVYAGGAGRGGITEGAGDSNRQWQRSAAVPGLLGQSPASYGKPQSQEQPFGRQSMPEGQEQQQRYPPTTGNYNNNNNSRQLQDDDNRRPTNVVVPNGQKPVRDVPPLTRRDSVLDAASKASDPGSRRADVPASYGRRPPMTDRQEDGGRRLSDLLQEDGGRRPSDTVGNRRPPQQPDARETAGQSSEPEDAAGGRRPSDHKNGRPETADYGSKPVVSRADANKGDGSSARDYVQRQQPRTDRRVALENDSGPKAPAVELGGNRASELRKLHFEATHHLKPVREQMSPKRTAVGDDHKADGKTTMSGERAPGAEGAVPVKPKDYATAVASSTGENDSNKTLMSEVRNRDELYKYARPDTLKIIKDNEPLKDSSNSKGNHRSDNDVGKSPSKIPKKDRSELKTPTRAATPKSPGESITSAGQKKLPMNKIQVGSAPSPNLKVVQSKIGSLQNTNYKPGGGQVKIENRKLDWKAGTRIVAKNDTYVPGGGDKKIQSIKLQWNAKPKVGSLENKTHKPGGGDKKIETVKLDFKDKAKPKIGSKDNIKHIPGGGTVKIEDQKLEIKAHSKVGSMDNMKHKPGGGEVKIFDDKSYIKQTAGQMGTPTKSQLQRSSSLKLYNSDERPKSQVKIVVTPTSEEDLYTKIGSNTSKGGPRKSANSRSTPSLQNSMVIPEEAVRSKKL